MIDFQNASFIKLSPAAVGEYIDELAALLVPQEELSLAFRGIRDSSSAETAGTFDRDAELDLWFSGLGRVRLEFKGSADIRAIGQLIGQHML